MCITLCHACIIYVHSTSSGMSRACVHLGVYEHQLSNGTCRELLDMAYQCAINEVMRTSIEKNFAIVMAPNNIFLVDSLLEFPSNSERHHLACSSLKVVMDKFSTLASPNCCNFILGSKRFVRSRMGTMDSIMAFKDHSGFKYIRGSRFLRQSKNKVFVSKMSNVCM